MNKKDKEEMLLRFGILILFIAVVICLVILMFHAPGDTKHSEAHRKEVYYTVATTTPASVQMVDNGKPLTGKELSTPAKKVKLDKSIQKDEFKKVKNCPWSKKTQKQLKKICNKYHISFSLIMSMAYTESRYNAKAVGDGGQAYGAWQVHPRTWNHIISKLGYSWNDMYQVVPACEVCCYIMRAHFKEYDNVFYALMAWNGGGEYAYRMLDAGCVSSYAMEIEARSERNEKG